LAGAAYCRTRICIHGLQVGSVCDESVMLRGGLKHHAVDFYMSLLKNSYLWALLAGTSCVFGFAPFGIFPIPVLALAVLFALWQRVEIGRASCRERV